MVPVSALPWLTVESRITPILKNASGALRVVYSQSFIGGGNDDHYGHGQHVAGIVSLGRPVYESYTVDPLCQAVEQAWKAGIVVVVAAGNQGRDNSQGTSGYATIQAPGNDPYVITVGAMKTMGTPSRADDLIASYSSKGPTLLDHIVKPDLVSWKPHDLPAGQHRPASEPVPE